MDTRPTLIPIDDVDTTRPLLALDFDGVFNLFLPDGEVGPARRHVRTAHGRGYFIDFDPAIVAAVEQLITGLDLQIGWLTSWGPNARAFIEQAFDGALAGGFVLAKQPKRYRGVIPGDWKAVALAHRIATTGQRWVWVDDEAIGVTGNEPGREHEFSDVPGLFVPTDPVTGLTLGQVEQIRAFLSAV